MLSKYHVEFAVPFQRHLSAQNYRTDDPVACEEFLVELLSLGYRITDILHEGTPLPASQLDGMLKTAALVLAANHLRTSLAIDEAETRHRFGLPTGSRHLQPEGGAEAHGHENGREVACGFVPHTVRV
jgi:hypothetical protein